MRHSLAQTETSSKPSELSYLDVWLTLLRW